MYRAYCNVCHDYHYYDTFEWWKHKDYLEDYETIN